MIAVCAVSALSAGLLSTFILMVTVLTMPGFHVTAPVGVEGNGQLRGSGSKGIAALLTVRCGSRCLDTGGNNSVGGVCQHTANTFRYRHPVSAADFVFHFRGHAGELAVLLALYGFTADSNRRTRRIGTRRSYEADRLRRVIYGHHACCRLCFLWDCSPPPTPRRVASSEPCTVSIQCLKGSFLHLKNLFNLKFALDKLKLRILTPEGEPEKRRFRFYTSVRRHTFLQRL